jgi:hypothetical protein
LGNLGWGLLFESVLGGGGEGGDMWGRGM